MIIRMIVHTALCIAIESSYKIENRIFFLCLESHFYSVLKYILKDVDEGGGWYPARGTGGKGCGGAAGGGLVENVNNDRRSQGRRVRHQEGQAAV